MLLDKWKSGLVVPATKRVHWAGLTMWASAAGRGWGVRFSFEKIAAAYVFLTLPNPTDPFPCMPWL